MKKTKENKIPDFEEGRISYKFIESLRRGRYNLNSSLGDLIDNSKDAGATRVHIDFTTELGDVIEIILADNGSGMDEYGLEGAFTLGLDKKREKFELGKFGIGGTLSCLGLAAEKTIVTRDKAGNINARSYNIESIKKFDSWGTSKLPVEKWMTDLLSKYLVYDQSGTIVVLSNFDLNNFSKRKSNIVNRVVPYVSKAYSDFISAGDLEIYLDGKEAPSRDAICWWHPETVKLHDKILKDTNIRLRIVNIKDVPTTESGSRMKNMGGYVYRCGRLIQSRITSENSLWGDRIFSRHNMYDWIRWSLNYEADSDSIMGTAFDKSEVIPSQEVMDRVSDFVKEQAQLCHALKLQKETEISPEDKLKREGVLNKLANDISKNTEIFEIEKSSDGALEVLQIVTPKELGEEVHIPNFIIQTCSLGSFSEIGNWTVNSNPSVSKFILQINTDHRYVQKFYLSKNSEVQNAAISFILPYCVALRQFEMNSECDLGEFRDSLNRKMRKSVTELDKS